MERWKTFLNLPRPSAAGAYGVEASAGVCRVARSHDGFPAVLFAFASGATASVPRRLATIAYDPPRLVELSQGGTLRETARLAVLECRTTDAQLGAYFFRVVDSVLLDEGRLLDEARFDAALDAVVTLFRALHRPGLRSVQGLWTELAMITWASDPRTALAAWHSAPHALHDFAAGSFRLEVKSTQKATREHAFLLDQLSSMTPGTTLIASVQLAEADTGADVRDLVDLITQRVGSGSEPARRLETIVAESLGQGWREAGEMRFSLELARRSVRLYRAEDVPTVPQPLPPQIKDVRFTADLSDAPALDLAAAKALGAPFHALLPDADPDD